MTTWKLPAFAAAIAGLGLVGSAHGTEKLWAKAQSGSFADKTCWTPGEAPLSVDNTHFDNGSAYAVTFTANHASNKLLIGHDTLGLRLGASVYILKSSAADAPSLVVANDIGDVANLTLRNGELRTVSAVLGYRANTLGNVVVTDSAVWNSSSVLTVAYNGNGSIVVNHGGQVHSDSGRIGAVSNSAGKVVIGNNGSLFNVDTNLLLGGNARGSGTLDIRPGGAANIGQLLDIRRGGGVKLQGGTLSAAQIENIGRLSVSGAGPQLTGNLNNSPGGIVCITSPEVTIAGDVVHNGAGFSTAPGSTVIFAGDVTGYSDFSGGGHLVFQTSYTPSAGGVAAQELIGDQASAAGASMPVSVTGSVAFAPDSSLNLSLGDDYYNQLVVSGDVTLADVDITAFIATGATDAPGNSYWPLFGDTFTLVTGQSIAYNGAINVPDLPNGLAFSIVQNPQSLVLQVIPEPASLTVLGAGGVLLLMRRRPRRRYNQ